MQATLAIRNEANLLSSGDLKDLERLAVETPVNYLDSGAVAETSEQRRMAIVLLLSEISALRENYDFPG